MKAMIATILIGAAMMMSGKAADPGAETKRSFLMLNDQSVEFVDGAPVLGYWHVLHRWDEKEKRESQVVDGIEFVIGKDFWKMVKDNGAKNSALSDIRVEKDGSLFYRGKLVELGLGVGHLDTVLRWHDWIVAVGTAADMTRSTIKGPISYLLWFGENSLKGSYRQISSGVTPPLRIYSK